MVVSSRQKARQQDLSSASSARADLRGVCGSPGHEELLGNVSIQQLLLPSPLCHLGREYTLSCPDHPLLV